MIGDNRIILLTKPYLTTYLYPDKFLLADWYGFMDLDEIKDGGNDIIASIEKTKPSHLLLDARKARGKGLQCESWLSGDFLPELVEKGIQKVAYIFPIEKVSRYFVERIFEANPAVEGKSFERFEDATNWLTGSPIQEMNVDPFILLKTTDDYSKINIRDIYYISTSEKKNVVHTEKDEYFTRRPLSELVNILPSSVFHRIHKSFIVNINKVKSMKYHAGGYYHLFLHDMEDRYLTVGRKYAKDFRATLESSGI